VVAYQNLHAESAACPEVGSEIPGLVSTINYCREHKCQWISLLLHITTVSLIIRPQRLVHWEQFNAARETQSSKRSLCHYFCCCWRKTPPISPLITTFKINHASFKQFRENSFNKGHRSNGALIPLLNH